MNGSSVAVAVVVVLAGVVVGCSKTDGGEAPAASASAGEARTIKITGTPATASAPEPASASATASASGSAAAPAPASASASASAPVRALASASASAPVRAPASASAKAVAEPPLKPASARLSGKNFSLDVASPGCRVDAPCTMTLRLVASGEFHINKEYPYKFVAAGAPGVTFLGSGEASTFSRAAGDFREDGEKTGVMTVRFKPTAAGEAKVSGTYKMSVCSASSCQIESQAVSLSVPVM